MILEGEQEFLRNSVRMALAVDDRDPDKMMRVRLVKPNPIIVVKDITAATIRGHGTFAEDTMRAILNGIRTLCIVRGANRDRVTLHSDEDYVDEDIVKRC